MDKINVTFDEHELHNNRVPDFKAIVDDFVENHTIVDLVKACEFTVKHPNYIPVGDVVNCTINAFSFVNDVWFCFDIIIYNPFFEFCTIHGYCNCQLDVGENTLDVIHYYRDLVESK